MTELKNNLQVIVNKESFSVLINDKILCSMSSGGCCRFRTQTEAEYAAKQYVRGYIGGSYLASDVENFVTTLS
jgi:hypothetical protein